MAHKFLVGFVRIPRATLVMVGWLGLQLPGPQLVTYSSGRQCWLLHSGMGRC